VSKDILNYFRGETMAYVNKQSLNIGVTKEVSEWVKAKAKSKGLSASLYIEMLLRIEMEKEKDSQ
jgi:predicted DNA binding CopG/RHH family protein